MYSVKLYCWVFTNQPPSQTNRSASLDLSVDQQQTINRSTDLEQLVDWDFQNPDQSIFKIADHTKT
jgi:hypothetical protein